MDWTTIITSTAIATCVASFLAVVVAPHVQWGIEKKREQRKTRQALIQAVRVVNGNYTIEEFRTMSEYHAVRPFLNKDLVKKIESDTFHISIAGPSKGTNNFWPEIMNEMSRLEKDWDLV